MQRVQSIVVVGGGSAGFIAALTVKLKNPQLSVTVLRSKEIGIIGVGEGSIPTLTKHLHGYLNIDPARFYREATPTWKMGIKFLWGPRRVFYYPYNYSCDSRFLKLSRSTGFYYGDDFHDGCPGAALMARDKAFARAPNRGPHIGLDAAYHIENEKFVGFLEAYAVEHGIKILEGTVAQTLPGEQGLAGLQLASGETLVADLFVDCSGFRSLLLGQTLDEPFISFAPSLYNDHAIWAVWQREPGETILPYTTAETMNSGWCWQIEHEHHVTRGYVHSSAFISLEQAERELREKNPRITGETRVVKFRSGRYERAWVKNVVAIGNAYGFVEPLESTSLGVICATSMALAETLRDDRGRVTDAYRAAYNQRSARAWDCIRRFLAMHFKFNTLLDTPYWRECAKADLAGAEPVVEYYQQNGPSTLWRQMLIDEIDMFKLDGYLVMLIGQQVPYESDFVLSDEERRIWSQIQQHHRQIGEQGLTVNEALACIRRPEWQWDINFYKQEYAPV